MKRLIWILSIGAILGTGMLGTGLLGVQSNIAVADEFILNTGGRIVGELLNPDESPRTKYVVKTDSGGVMTLSAAQVKEVHAKSEVERRYDAVLPKMPHTADGNWIIAEWCKKIGLTKKRALHLEQVLKYDPDHVDARHALGYSRVGGKWMKAREFRERQGYVLYKGSWRLKQDVEVDQRDRRTDLAQKEWTRKVRMWRSWLGSRTARRVEEARAEFRDLDNPLAAKGIGELLEDEEYYELKRLFIDVLERLGSSGDGSLAECAMKDKDRRIRELCWDVLADRPTPSARIVSELMKGLKSKDNHIVNMSAIGLGKLQDPESILPLIDALVTEHKFKTGGSGGNISPTFGSSSDGSSTGGLSAGARPRYVTRQLENREVLTALVAITEGANFQFNQDAWKRWYAEAQTPPDLITLRRDE
jgi:hypothetical protein